MEAGFVYVCLRQQRPVLRTARLTHRHSVLPLALEALRPASNHRQPSTTTHTLTTNTFRPTSINFSQATTNSQLPSTPTEFPFRPRWPRSCALACPPQNPATLSLKHRTPQLAGPDNMASIRELLPFAMTSSTAPANLLQQLHRQRRHHTRHHRCRLRHPSRRHSQHQRLQHQLALHSQTLPHRRHRQ